MSVVTLARCARCGKSVRETHHLEGEGWVCVGCLQFRLDEARNVALDLIETFVRHDRDWESVKAGWLKAHPWLKGKTP